MAKKQRKTLYPQKGAQALAMQLKVDFMIFGGAAGAGKSHLLLTHPLQHVRDKDFNAIFFRRVTTQLTGLGGLWDESKKIYEDFNTSKRTKPQLQHTFPSGAQFQFMHMQHEDDKTSHQGLQYSAILFDELTHFSETQVTYLLGRLRSDADSDSYAIGSCNPDPDSWVLKWIEWYLDEEGYPDKSKQGKIRYFVVVQDSPIFSDSAEQLKLDYPDACKVWNPVDEEYVPVEPKTFTFVAGTIFDNPILIKKNPKYLAELNSLSGVERARLLDGNWYARAEGSGSFKREWLKKAEKEPPGCKAYRGWDKASSVPSEENRYPDYTACVKILKSRDGFYYIRGDYSPSCRDPMKDGKDEKDALYGAFRQRPGERDRLMLEQAEYDGDDCYVVLPKDPGAAGEAEFTEASKKFAEAGFTVIKDVAAQNKSKLKKYEPFSSACENGLVYIIESSFPNKVTLEYFYKTNEAFNGERSTNTRKDDIPDATATAFNAAAKGKVLPKFSLPEINDRSRKDQVMNQSIPIFN